MEEYLMGFDSGFFGVTESQVPLLLWRVGPVEPGSCQAAWQALLMDPIQRNSLEVGVLATRASRHKKLLLKNPLDGGVEQGDPVTRTDCIS